jgi:peptidoglycan/xylan/chitin deacetylase (PgdA/CDA1 family)
VAEPRVRVCVTFDLDAMSPWLFNNTRNLPSVFSRGEYGPRRGAGRLLALLDRYAIPTTWFVPGHTADTHPDLVTEVHRQGHELAHHGYCHERPTLIDEAQERRMLERGIEVLERIAGKRPAGYRAPYWEPGVGTMDLLREFGFTYDSSLAADDYRLYRVRKGDVVSQDGPVRFGPESPLIEVPIRLGLSDWEYFNYVPPGSGGNPQQGGKLPDEVYEIWAGEFDYMYRTTPGGVLTYTIHPQVMGRGPRVLMLERLIRHIREHPGVEFCTVENAVDAWLDTGQLTQAGVA